MKDISRPSENLTQPYAPAVPQPSLDLTPTPQSPIMVPPRTPDHAPTTPLYDRGIEDEPANTAAVVGGVAEPELEAQASGRKADLSPDDEQRNARPDAAGAHSRDAEDPPDEPLGSTDVPPTKPPVRPTAMPPDEDPERNEPEHQGEAEGDLSYDTAVTSAESPDRSAALQRLFDYAGASAGRHTEDFLSEMSTRPEAEQFLDTLIGQQSLELPAEAAGEQTGMDLHETVGRAEEAFLQRHYHGELAATGLGFEIVLDGVEFHIADPAAFARTLSEAQIPAEGEQRELFYSQLNSIVGHALQSASMTLVAQESERALNALGGREPQGLVRDLTAGAVPIPEEERNLAEGLFDNGFEMMRELIRLEAPPELVDSVRQMVMADAEDARVDWAVGQRIIDQSGGQIGVDRLVTTEEWELVHGFLEHLQAASIVDSGFVSHVRDSLLADINKALTEPDPTVIPSIGIPSWDNEVTRMRQEIVENTRPLLEYAQQRIKEILGPLPPLETPESFEPYQEQVDYINALLDEGVDPTTIPGYFRQGGMCYTFFAYDDYKKLIKIPRVVTDDEFLRGDDPPPLNAARNHYIDPLLRGDGGTGLERIVTYKDYDENDPLRRPGAIVTEFIEGTRFADLSGYQRAQIPEVHLRTFFRKTCEELAQRGLRPDYDDYDIIHKLSYDRRTGLPNEVGIFVIDYGTAEYHREQPEEASVIARQYGRAMLAYHERGEPLPMPFGQTFYREYKAAFGEAAAADLLQDWRDEGVLIPPELE